MGVMEDILFIVIGLFSSALLLGMGYFAITQLMTFDQFNTPTATIVQQNFQYLDGVVAFGVVLLAAAAIALAYFLPSHPVFVFTYIIVILVLIIIGPTFSNIYATVATNTVIGSAFDAFPITALLVGNLPLISIALSILIALSSYGKAFGQGGMSQL